MSSCPPPAISVVLSVYNGERYLAQAIESVLAQTFADFEFLILDDGSRDGSRAILERYARRDARIRLTLRENRGLIVSLNELVVLARAPIIARMDADDICRSDRFALQYAFLDAHPEYGVVGSWSADIDAEGRPLAPIGADHPCTHDEMLAAIARGGQLICHPSAMMRRSVVVDAGGYHAAFRHCEDLDLWLRLASLTQLGNIPERLLQYRRYPAQVSSRHATEQQIGSAVARLAYAERAAGRSDPTADLERLPPLDAFDDLFGREGVTRTLRSEIALHLVYSREAMGGDGFALLLQHVEDGGETQGLWRTVIRLVRFGLPGRALRLARALLAR
ncbi:glycosyltransferase [Novosphingobium sp. MBES04]|uniref:glycosyltransferase n=1 Tax=Novosphingobium sp. MBES04 TaxID=1206458 RepID=UPI00057EECE6|nr:glycosyltransferase [Novosphingobium sp. MBES04]GAM06002.1 family 2 glycosyl transferase [Novosphingobium sp. MBES04]